MVHYTAEFTGGTQWGCRVGNTMRLYCVLASLLWNGVEATNMYLKLVRVFNSKISNFMLIAGLIAWGESCRFIIVNHIVFLLVGASACSQEGVKTVAKH